MNTKSFVSMRLYLQMNILEPIYGIGLTIYFYDYWIICCYFSALAASIAYFLRSKNEVSSKSPFDLSISDSFVTMSAA